MDDTSYTAGENGFAEGLKMEKTESRLLPTDIDAEKGVLAACIGPEENTVFFEVRALIKPEDFSVSDYDRLFRILCSMQDRGVKLDVTELYHELVALDLVKSMGGISWLLETFYDQRLAYRGNIGHYIARMLDLSTRRRIVRSAQVLMHEAADQSSPIEESLATFNSLSSDVATTDNQPETAEDIIEDAGGWQEFMKPDWGIQSPWKRFNDVTAGYHNGELVVIGARPSMGKTALMMESARKNARDGHVTAIYSYEMTKESLVKRMLSRETQIPYVQIKTGEFVKSERASLLAAFERIKSLPLYIVQSPGKSPMWVRCHAERLKRRMGLKIAYVDYLQLVPSSTKASNRNQEVGAITREFKSIATQLEIPLILLSQLNRANETRPDKRPGMADLRDSGEIEAHADLIGFVHREEYYKRDDESLRGLAELIIAKQRNGDTPIINLIFLKQYGAFVEPAQ